MRGKKETNKSEEKIRADVLAMGFAKNETHILEEDPNMDLEEWFNPIKQNEKMEGIGTVLSNSSTPNEKRKRDLNSERAEEDRVQEDEKESFDKFDLPEFKASPKKVNRKGRKRKSERLGQRDRSMGIEEFNNFIDACNLEEIPVLGRKFTWIGSGGKRSKIDRFLAEVSWLEKKEDTVVKSLPRSLSDHIPILLYNGRIDWGPRPFKMINAWVGREDCLQLIKEVFDSSGDKSFLVKLKKVKTSLKAWHGAREDLNDKVIRLEKRINEIELREHYGELNQSLMQELKDLKMEMVKIRAKRKSNSRK
ncbi:hypothetical protein V6N13_064997 [Hibiscus sabdariffa]